MGLTHFFLVHKLIPLSIEANVLNNRIEHRTNDYESKNLIVRRGQAFKVAVKFNRQFDRRKDQVALQFTVGKYKFQMDCHINIVKQT